MYHRCCVCVCVFSSYSLCASGYYVKGLQAFFQSRHHDAKLVVCRSYCVCPCVLFISTWTSLLYLMQSFWASLWYPKFTVFWVLYFLIFILVWNILFYYEICLVLDIHLWAYQWCSQQVNDSATFRPRPLASGFDMVSYWCSIEHNPEIHHCRTVSMWETDRQTDRRTAALLNVPLR